MTQISFVFVLFSACVSSEQAYTAYGSEITDKDAVSTEAFLAMVSAEATTYKVKGTILEVCQMKGCWMTLASENSENIRVTFKDYGFFVPKDISGSEVILEGVAQKEVLSEEIAQHYADDGNQRYDPSMRNTISFVAEGVLVAVN